MSERFIFAFAYWAFWMTLCWGAFFLYRKKPRP